MTRAEALTGRLGRRGWHSQRGISMKNGKRRVPNFRIRVEERVGDRFITSRGFTFKTMSLDVEDLLDIAMSHFEELGNQGGGSVSRNTKLADAQIGRGR